METNISGINYNLPLPYYEKNNRFYFQNWLLYVFDNDGIEYEQDNYLSVKIPCNIIDKFVSFFHANIWYDDIKEYTIESHLILLPQNEINYMLKNNSLTKKFKNKINKIIKNDKWFFRLNSVSSKYKGHLPFDDAIKHISLSKRTRNKLIKNKKHYLFIRKYIDFSLYNEYRCFITKKQLLGVSIYGDEQIKYTDDIKYRIITFINNIRKLIEYEDYTLDIALGENDIFVIEINSPVYMFSGSCNFTLNEVKVFLIENKKEYTYPFWR